MKGFIALMSVIIISIILLGLALSGSSIAFFTRFNGVERQSFAEAQSLARSCADAALLQVAQNAAYTATHQLVHLGSDNCYIESIATLAASSTQKTVQVVAAAGYHGSYATVAATGTVAY